MKPSRDSDDQRPEPGAEQSPPDQTLERKLGRMHRIQSSLTQKLQMLLELSAPERRSFESFNVHETLEVTMQSLMGNFGASSGAVLEIHPRTPSAESIANLGLPVDRYAAMLEEIRRTPRLTFVDRPIPKPELASLGFGAATVGALHDMGVHLAVPLPLEKDAWGLIFLGPRLSGAPFSEEEVGLIALFAKCMTLAVRCIRYGERNLTLQAEKFRVRGILEEFVSPELVEQMLAGVRTRTEPERRRVSVVIADIRDFTAISERTSADALGRCLNQFYSAMTDVVLTHGGVVDKFIGDAVMATFGAPITVQDAEARAVRAAIAMVGSFRDLITHDEEFRGVFGQVGVGAGVCSGEAVVGSLGSGKRVDYTVIGRTVNLAARLSGLARAGEVLVDEATYGIIQAEFLCQLLAPTSIKGIGDLVHTAKVLAELPHP